MRLRETAWWKAVALVVATVVVYTPALRAGWVDFDDAEYVSQNPVVTGKGALYRIWFTTDAPDYYPLTYSSFWLQWRLWGENALGYHLVNVLLHASSACLLWRVLKRLRVPAAWFAALLFAVHPVNVPSVAWIIQLKNCQAMLLYATSLLLYLRFEQEGTRASYGLSLGTFALALLSKSAVVMLPIVLLLCAWWERRRIAWRDIRRTVPFFSLAAVFGLVTVWFHQTFSMAGIAPRPEGFLNRLVASGWVVGFYVSKAIAPVGLSMVYTLRDVDVHSPGAFVPLALLVVGFGLAWRKRTRWGAPLVFALLYFVVSLFPVLGFFDQSFYRVALVADPWQYFAIIGILALAAGVGARIARRWGPRTAVVLGGILVVTLGTLSWSRAEAFRSAESLWRDTLSKNPTSWLAHNNMGNALAAEDAGSAMAHYREAIRLKPDYARAHYNLGTLLYKARRFPEAIESFERVLALEPDYREAYNNAAAALYQLGRVAEAVDQWQEALRRKPDWPEVLYNLARIRATHTDEHLRDGPEAVRLAERAYALVGDARTSVLGTLAAAYAEAGRFEDALHAAREALRLARARGEQALAVELERQIDSYQAKRPVREFRGR